MLSKLIQWFKGFGLKSKLIVTMSALFILTSLSLFVMAQRAQKSLMNEIDNDLEDLTRALQVSVQQMKSPDQIDQHKLKEMFEKFKRKGINEVSILSEDKEIVASSNPKKIGQKDAKADRPGNFVIQADIGDKTIPSVRELKIPIIIGEENYGSINIVMHLDNYTTLSKQNYFYRVFATLVIFLIGTLVIILMANRYTRPINEIVSTTKKIAGGEFAKLPVSGHISPEIGELFVNFNNMVDKLEEQKKLEKRIEEMEHSFQIGQLSSAIAHEVKNPLNFMSLAVGEIKDEIAGAAIDDSKKRYILPLLDSLEDEIKKIGNLVTNFLEYGRPLKLDMEYLDLSEMIRDLLTLISTKLNDLTITVSFEPEESLHLIGDKEKLSGCFLNLFLNSIDSIRENGTIVVSAVKEQRNVIIRFRDSGRGVPDSMFDKIFEPYVSSKSTGMGLGLAFTKKIVLEHGGDIWLNKDYTGGAEFIIRLPLTT